MGNEMKCDTYALESVDPLNESFKNYFDEKLRKFLTVEASAEV